MISDIKTTQCWNGFISSLSRELDPDEVEAWVNKLQLVHCTPESMTIGGINQFFSNWIRDRHQHLVRQHLAHHFSIMGINPEFQLVIQVGKEGSDTSEESTISKGGIRDWDDGLNPLFEFENFINGGNSDIAYAAARAVGENIQERKYNPLFICGDVGLGKTHLVQAIGLKARQSEPGIRIKYASSKEFTNEVINGIRFGKIQDVRYKYRNLDILMIDDIQFLENKESTQEEFFHTFNELIQSKKQIVLTADRYPREIKKLEERLVNRFNSGMVARIYPPDFETRVAIIRAKVERMSIPLDEDIINYVANMVKSNVRDIEGILIHLEASWSLLGQEITMENTKRVLKDVLNLENNPKTVDNILRLTANRFALKVSDLKSDRRDKDISKTRQIAMYIVREVTDLSFPVIGKHFGGKNHTSVMQACKKTKEWIDRDPEIKQVVTAIIREVSG